MTYYTRPERKIAWPPPPGAVGWEVTEFMSGYGGGLGGPAGPGWLGMGPPTYIEVDRSTPIRFAHDNCLPEDEFDISFLHDPGTGELVEIHFHQRPPWCWVPRWGGVDKPPDPAISCTYCGAPGPIRPCPFATRSRLREMPI